MECLPCPVVGVSTPTNQSYSVDDCSVVLTTVTTPTSLGTPLDQLNFNLSGTGFSAHCPVLALARQSDCANQLSGISIQPINDVTALVQLPAPNLAYPILCWSLPGLSATEGLTGL